MTEEQWHYWRLLQQLATHEITDKPVQDGREEGEEGVYGEVRCNGVACASMIASSS